MYKGDLKLRNAPLLYMVVFVTVNLTMPIKRTDLLAPILTRLGHRHGRRPNANHCQPAADEHDVVEAWVASMSPVDQIDEDIMQGARNASGLVFPFIKAGHAPDTRYL